VVSGVILCWQSPAISRSRHRRKVKGRMPRIARLARGFPGATSGFLVLELKVPV